MSLIVVCGAECGINTGSNNGAGTDKHGTFYNNTIGIETTVVRTAGTKSYSFAAAASAPSIEYYSPAAQTIAYARFYFRMTSAAPAANTLMLAIGVAAGSNPYVSIDVDGTITFNVGGGAATHAAITANTWYGIELEVDVSANPHTGRWRFWSAAAGWVTQTAPTNQAQVATTLVEFTFEIANISSGLTMYLDDIILGTGTVAGQDYDAANPQGGKVVRYRPNADGVHSFTAGDFGYEAAGADVLTSDTNVYTHLDETDQTSLADFIRQKVIRTTGYIAVAFEDESTEYTPRAVGVVSTYHSAGVNANTQSLKVSDDNWTSTTAVWTDDDVSDTAIDHRQKVLLTKPSGGAWNQMAVNQLQARWGYSSDVTDIPYLDTVSVEVEWIENSHLPYLTPIPQIVRQ